MKKYLNKFYRLFHFVLFYVLIRRFKKLIREIYEKKSPPI